MVIYWLQKIILKIGLRADWLARQFCSLNSLDSISGCNSFCYYTLIFHINYIQNFENERETIIVFFANDKNVETIFKYYDIFIIIF